MRKMIRGGAAALLVALAFLLAMIAGIPASLSASAAGAYDFVITSYDVEMTVSADRTIAVKEVITAAFSGYDSHGIIRDFPLGDGVRYQDIQAVCDHPDFSPYTQTDDISLLSLYLRGEGLTKDESRTYTLTYTMIVPALSEEGYLPINVIGYGWQATVQNVTVAVTVPDGLSAYLVYSGRSGTTQNSYAVAEQNGNTVLITAQQLPYECGITLDLSFGAGVLTASFDYTILYALLIGAALLVLAVLVKLFVCRQPDMTTTVNLEAPEKMDPLLMGKLIDNSVDSEDLGAAVFYLADQGYLRINVQDSSNPILFKTEKQLSAVVPDYLKAMYSALFANGRESVQISELNNSFYRTADDMKRAVDARAGSFYDKKSKYFTGLFGVLTILLLGGFAWVYSFLTVFAGYMYWVAFVICGVSFVLAAAASNLAVQREHKWKKGKKIALILAGVLGGCVVSFASCLLPCAAYGWATGLILGVFSAIVGGISGAFLCRNQDYTAQLGQILGFKQFIVFTERDKIEFMLKENPELYYHILPYAQVLGVTNAWTEKFKGLDMRPPEYVSYHSASMMIDCMAWHALFRSMNGNFARNMVSRPSSSSHAGGHGGGFGGGFGGGGFGGGGGRGC